jgi:NAD(P)-dependent dehydrogenase (short-subunit alcohol dehydrogenase family)
MAAYSLSKFQTKPWYFEEAGCAAAQLPLKGRVAIVAGSSSGIGKAAALALSKAGCTVVVTSRNIHCMIQRAEAAAKSIAANGGDGAVEAMSLDLSGLEDVRRFASEFLGTHSKLHYLSENAGMGPLGFGWNGPWVSAQKYEMLCASNYVGHFLLVNLLTPILAASGGRVAATSSIMHWLHDSDLDTLPPENQMKSDEQKSIPVSFRQYGSTKLLQIMMCFEMQRRTPSVPCTPVAPGLISTAVVSAPVAGKPTDMGALTALHALLSETRAGSSGLFLQPYYSPPHQSPPAPDWIVPLWEPISQHFTWRLHQWIAHPDAHSALASLLWLRVSALHCTTNPALVAPT